MVDSWPLRDRTLPVWPILAAVVLAAGFIAWASGQWWMGLVAIAALGTALWRLWLPIRYIFHDEGVRQVIWGP